MSTARFLAVLLFLALPACGVLESRPAPADADRVSGLIAQRRFADAIAVLEESAGTGAGASHRLAQVREMARRYDAEQAEKVLELQMTGDWAAAFRALDEGLRNYPDGEALQQARAILLREQAEELARLERQWLLQRAQWLVEALPLSRAIARVHPQDPDAALRAQNLEEEAADIALALEREADSAIAAGQLQRAESFLEMAARLEPDETREQRLEGIQAALEAESRRRAAVAESERERQRLRQRQARERRIAELTATVHRRLLTADLAGARRTLEELERLAGPRPDIVELGQAVDAAIAAKVAELTHRGDQLYGAGKLREARHVWAQAARLDPGNAEVQARIDRADRVLRRVQELQQRR